MVCVRYSLQMKKGTTKQVLEMFHSSFHVNNPEVSHLLWPSLHCEWSLCSRTRSRPITLHTCCITKNTFVSVSSCGLLKWDATPLEWYNSSSLGLPSLSGSLLSPVTYLGGFLKRSQRKLFHFCSHLTLSNGAGWRDSWLEVRRDIP